MIESIIEWSIRNRFVVILASVALGLAGLRAMLTMPVDAIPDLSENQVIVFADWMGRSPQEIEDQVTYPLSVNLQGLAGVKVVRSSSEFNFSMITIIFDDDTDYYVARQRVLEKLSIVSTFLPPGVTPYLAPDATAVGQIFWYTVEGDGRDLSELRSIQDWFVRYQLNSVPGVAEVASVGGAPKEYQIDLDPETRHELLNPACALCLGEAHQFERVGDIVECMQPGKQGFAIVLEHIAELDVLERPAVEQHLAGIAWKQVGDHVDQRALAAAIRTEHRNELAARQVEIEIVVDDGVGEAFA